MTNKLKFWQRLSAGSKVLAHRAYAAYETRTGLIRDGKSWFVRFYEALGTELSPDLRKSSARVAQGLRKSVRFAATILVLLWIGAGNVWGAETKTEGFETKSAGNSYQGTVNVAANESDCGISWEIYYGTVSTSSKITGENSVALRLYTSNNYGYLESKTNVTGLTKVTFNAKAATSNSASIKIDVEYSTDNGSSWSYMKKTSESGTDWNNQSLTTSSANYSAFIPTAAISTSSNYRIKISINSGSTKPSKSNAQLTIDDVVFTYTLASGYSITYHCNGATSGCPSNASSQTALPSTLPTPTRTGCTFAGWYTNEGLTSAATAGATLSANADLYAKWTCNVTLKRNGATETINNVVVGTDIDDIDGAGAQGGCSEWTFVGWSKTQRAAQNNSSAMDLVTTVDGPGSYYAVYSHTESGGGETTVSMNSFSSTSGDVEDDENVSYEAAQGSASTAPAINSNEIRIYQNGGLLTITANNGVKLTTITIGSSMATSVSYSVDGGTASSIQSISADGTYTLEDIEADEVVFTCKGTDKYSRLYLNSLSVTYSGGSTTYYSTTASCCTQLGSIKGSISWTHPNEAVLSWNDMSHVDENTPYTVTYRTGSDAFGSANVGSITTNGAGKKTCTITGLSCNTTYDFKIAVTAASDYCDKDSVMANKNSGKWSITRSGSPAGTVTGGTFTTKISSDAVTEACDGSTINIEATASPGYQFSSWTITKAGGGTETPAAATASTSFTMPSDNVTVTAAFGYKTYTITYKDKGGGAFTGTQTEPPTTHTYGTPTTLKIPTKENYSFGGWFTESDCESGAVGNASSATLGATAFTADITLYAKWVANTHTVTYASNGADGGSVPVDANSPYNHGANVTVLGNTGELTKTHYSFGGWSDGVTTYEAGEDFVISDDVTLSAVWDCAEYVNVSAGTHSHGTFTLSATGTRYTCDGAQVITVTPSANTGYAFSAITQTGLASGVTIDNNAKTVTYAQWANGSSTINVTFAAKSYTVTLDQQSGSGGSANVSATYDAAMPSATMPTRSGYTFGGYYGSEGGEGTQYYAADGSSAHTWDVADAKTLYAKWTAKNYTITLDNEGADSGKEGTESISVTFDANTNLTSAITKPVRDGYKFGGYYTAADGSGTQIIDENGNVNASVASYTSATKQWIYAGNIELHAYWKPSYTVTWSVNGATTTEQVVSGEQVAALPAAPTSSDCDDAKVFVGWRSTAIAGVSAANPGSIFTTQAASPAITGDVTFYAVFADVSARQAITLTFPDDNRSNNGSSSYTSTWTAKAGDFSFTVSNFNNNNWSSWTYIKCGRKDNTSVGTITTDNAISFRVDSVYVTIDAITESKVNSAKVYVSGTSDFATSSYIDIPKSTGVMGKKFASPATEKYYKIAFDCASHTSNGIVQISKIVFAQKSDTANYVTSCSSCDADATFTNTTPAVSEIGCTSATLTMEDGLATVGTDGCHMSDYGFVIGTSDNPVIGGSGVTKLQVGTSDPTIGEDFSYDAEGLSAGTQYYIRAYATNRHGTAYSSSQNFWTKGVSSIAITTAPTKTTYIAGESFDASGMVVKATLVDGTTPDVTGDVTYSTTGLSAGTNQDFAINYSLCGDNVSTNQKINVYAMTVTEGAADDKGVVTYTSGATFSISSLATHWTANIVVTNGTANDNGDGTYTVTPSGAGAVSVTVNYVEAAQVKVYYKVDGVTVTGLTRDVYQSETTTLPSASDLATAMTAQGMDIPDDSYPNFVGWSETEFGAQTSEPTLVTGTPTINAEKTYYAVYTNLGKKTILPTDFPSSYGDGDRSIDGVTYYRSGVANPSGSIQFRASKNGTGYIYSKTSLAYILKIEVSGANLVINACSDASGTLEGEAITPVGTAPRVYTFPANKQYFQIKGNGETNTASRIDIYYSPATVEYMTQFCTRYDITGVTKSGTAVTGGTLSSNYNSACEGKSVELEAVVSTGYQFNGWTIKKTDDLTQDVTGTLLGANASSLTPPAFSMPDYAITVSASITEKELTGWTWKQALPDESIAIPSKVVLYVGQRAEFDLIEYDPSDVLEEKKGYGVTKEDTYLTQNAKAAAYYKADAKAAVESTTLTLTSTSNISVQEVINIQIKALPSVTFEDHVHSVVFSAVAATIDETDKRVVYLTKTTPTTSDFSGTTYNTCEEQHEHLVGWIESSWADEHPDATHSQIAGAGAGVFYTAGASIDVEAQNGKTFYAVWSKIE